jgi:hypothetical protein
MNIYKSELLDHVDQLTKFMGKTKNYHKWFKENAIIYNKINKIESVKVQKRNRTKIKRCFDNCYKAVYKEQNLKYIEGYTMSLIPIEHAFLVNENNEIIDPTLSINTDISNDRYGSEYYGIEIPRNMIARLRIKDQYSPLPFLYFKYLTEKRFINKRIEGIV